MKRLMDIHTHAVASGHAYSTVDENLRWAAEQGLQLVALTDHAPAMKDTTCHAYFANLHVLPEMLHGVRLLKGIELNILDFDGTIDMDEAVLQNTQAFLKVMENPYVDIIGHPGDPRYAVDYRELFRVAKETGTLLEINNASLTPGGFREGSRENIKKILLMSMEEGQPVVLGSDAHFYRNVGDFSYAEDLLKELQFPEELILNNTPEKFLAGLRHGRK